MRKAREFDPEYVVVLDGDGQHDPEDIPVLFAKLKESEADMVVGSRYVIGGKANPPLYRHYGLVLFNFLNNQDWTMSVQDVQSGYRVFNRKTLELFIDTSEDGFGVEMEQILIANNNGLKIVEAPISIQYSGLANTSKKNPFFHGLDLISTILRIMILEKPLMISGIPGVVSLIIGLLGQWRFMKIYNTTGSFNVTVGVVSIFFLLNGIVLLITSLLMYGMILMRRDSWLGRSP